MPCQWRDKHLVMAELVKGVGVIVTAQLDNTTRWDCHTTEPLGLSYNRAGGLTKLASPTESVPVIPCCFQCLFKNLSLLIIWQRAVLHYS